MKSVGILLISFYQWLVSPIFHIVFGPHICRYSPSCSEYTKEQIKRRGLLKGSLLGLKQLSSCHPFANVATKKV